MGLEQILAILYALIIALVVLFQLCLVFGAPWGQITQGGRYEGPLPVTGRVVALLSGSILICMGASITSAAGLGPYWAGWTAYAAIAMQALSTTLNWITPSQKERLLWGPITSFMFLLAAYVVFLKWRIHLERVYFFKLVFPCPEFRYFWRKISLGLGGQFLTRSSTNFASLKSVAPGSFGFPESAEWE